MNTAVVEGWFYWQSVDRQAARMLELFNALEETCLAYHVRLLQDSTAALFHLGRGCHLQCGAADDRVAGL